MLILNQSIFSNIANAQRSDVDEEFSEKISEAIENGLSYLANKESDGRFTTQRWGQNLGICALVGLSFLSAGHRLGVGTAGKLLERIAKRIVSFAQPSGFINDPLTQSHGPMYEHAFATLFLAELHGTNKTISLGEKIESAINVIIRSQNDRGGWRYDPNPSDADLSVTVSQIMALRAAKNSGFFVPEESVMKAIQFVRLLQNPDGGFAYKPGGGPSKFALTAAAVVAIYNSGINSGINSESTLDQAFQFLDASLTNNQIADASYFFYAHYYSSQAYWHRGNESWIRWYSRLKNLVTPMQMNNGSWTDSSQGPEYATAMACLILNTPRSLLPIYQR